MPANQLPSHSERIFCKLEILSILVKCCRSECSDIMTPILFLNSVKISDHKVLTLIKKISLKNLGCSNTVKNEKSDP